MLKSARLCIICSQATLPALLLQAPVHAAEYCGRPPCLLCALVPRHSKPRGELGVSAAADWSAQCLCSKLPPALFAQAGTADPCAVSRWPVRYVALSCLLPWLTYTGQPPDVLLCSTPCSTCRFFPLQNAEWVLATAEYGGEFVAVVQRGNAYATQFHPEKSGAAGLDVLRSFLEPEVVAARPAPEATSNGALRTAVRVCPGAAAIRLSGQSVAAAVQVLD